MKQGEFITETITYDEAMFHKNCTIFVNFFKKLDAHDIGHDRYDHLFMFTLLWKCMWYV